MRKGKRRHQAGMTSLQMLAILVPVLFAFVGFAVDLGRLYLIRGELQTAADAMALAAASRLIGTDSSIANAMEQADFTIGTDQRNTYNFGTQTVGWNAGNLNSDAPSQQFYTTAAASQSAEGPGGGDASGATAHHVRIVVRADAPLVFFNFISLAQQRKTSVEVAATAGVSAPLCTACGIEPLAVAALDADDTTNYGFVPNARYTFGFQCNEGTPPGPLTEGAQRIDYLLLNRYNDQATVFSEERSQAYRIGSFGMPPSSRQGMSCLRIDAEESIWASALPGSCQLNRVPPAIGSMVCGLASRFDTTVSAGCSSLVGSDADAIAALGTPDTDTSDLQDYAAYNGVGRRVITIAIVPALNTTQAMRVISFRQFVIEPNPDGTNIDPSDPNARFIASYIGYPMPLKQGRFDGCQLAAGPGKVVMHR
jgi:Flp pilus assembly protein TadG